MSQEQVIVHPYVTSECSPEQALVEVLKDKYRSYDFSSFSSSAFIQDELSDLFKKNSSEDKSFRILIIAPKGGGKTRLTEHLAYRLSLLTPKPDYLSLRFKYIFRISLNRWLEDIQSSTILDKSLAQFIFSTFVQENSLGYNNICVAFIQSILSRKEKSDTLLILDDYEKIVNFLGKSEYLHLLAQALAFPSVIITSSGYEIPANSEQFKDRNDRLYYFKCNRHLEITFSPPQIIDLLKNYKFSMSPQEEYKSFVANFDGQKSQCFRFHLMGHPLLYDIAQNPLILSYLCKYYGIKRRQIVMEMLLN